MHRFAALQTLIQPKMKLTGTVAVLGLVGNSLAALNCQNNCGRQVAGTARASPAFEARESSCSSLLIKTTTVTPPAATVTAAAVFNRNVHGPRDEPPTLTDEKPAYASACADITAYWNACQCFSIVPTVVTVTAPAPTTTVSGPTCTQGLEYAIYAPKSGSSLQAKLDAAFPRGLDNVNIANLIQGTTPDFTGVTPSIGPVGSNWQAPITVYGHTAGPDTYMGKTLIDHRGYLVPAVAGDYTISVPYNDDSLFIWVGENAITGFSKDNFAVRKHYYNPGVTTYTISVTAVGEPIAIRALWINYGGGGALDFTISDPSNAVVLGSSSEKNRYIISSCSGNGATVPEWPAWESETFGQ
ncbi:hypothetical protein HJFPF1_10522 [Paramyrothecium foliicola]|nr:hypothetical protein HJFPF1_10522 [Paramyrothecium foliicola]